MEIRGRMWMGAGTLGVAVAATVAVMAQGRADVGDPGSLSALTGEIRQLRLAVEDSTRSQTQTQALSVYLSAEQARLVQLSSRLDAARKDLDALTSQSRDLASGLSETASTMARTTNAVEREQLVRQSREIEQEQRSVAAREQQARAREADLSQSLDVENARWTDLIGRLEQAIKR
jgi:hypothetical protein